MAATADTTAEISAAQFSRPYRQILSMLAVLTLVGAGTYLAYPAVAPIFLANVWLNGTIVGLFFIGVLICFGQAFRLFTSVRWITGFIEKREGHSMSRAPALLAPLAALLRSHTSRSAISTTSSRSILDSVAQRIDEAREITRYIVNTLIFLGLLGTFWGLATTIPAVVETISNLAPTDGDERATEVFQRLIGGLESQLEGMGTAFASSLLGLAGSLVVGLLEIFVGHGQNRFYRELEDWLSGITRVGLVGDGETIDQYSLAAVLDHMNYQMEQLHEMFQRAEEGRMKADARMSSLADAVNVMADRDGGMTALTEALERVADGQDNITELLAGQSATGGTGMDQESRGRLRSIDVQLLKMSEELAQGRQAAMDDLRGDIGALTRAIRQLTRTATQAQEQGE